MNVESFILQKLPNLEVFAKLLNDSDAHIHRSQGIQKTAYVTSERQRGIGKTD